jgi:hypothetical protein
MLQDGIKILPNLALQIPIPWKPDEPRLMDNSEEVRRDVLRQELRWSHKAPEVLEVANKDIQDQVELGFIRAVSNKECQAKPGRYLHWLLVHRPDKLSTRVRIVFDASRKAYCDGKSLNGSMLKGPSLLNEVFDVHNGNREKPILVTADISKMFPRFKIPTQDQRLHRFWWQDQVYEFSSLIFGTVAAPFMANFGVRYIANKYKDEFPHILEAVKTGIYVDDLSLSFETAQEATRYVKDFITIFEKHDLPFRKWSCNDRSVLQHLPPEWRGQGMLVKPEETSMAAKTLGVRWDTGRDIIMFAVEPWIRDEITTLRRVVSYTPTLFDPQGLLLPLTLIAKIIISVICMARSVVHVDWDTPLEPLAGRVDGLAEILRKWCEYTDSLHDLKQIVFPRAMRSGAATSIQMHLFTDASELAYGATIYIRSILGDGSCEVNLLCAKNRVAHLAQARTIAEMELMGICIGAKMFDRVKSTLDRVDKVFLWTDSRVCLYWISKPARQWKAFVAHRVTDVYAFTKDYVWRHVPGKQNPADLATRGLSMEAFRDKKCMWIHGPAFLHGPEDKYPQWTPEVKDDDRLPPKSALCALLPGPLRPSVLGSKGGGKYRKDKERQRRRGRYLKDHEKVVLVSKIGKHKGPKGAAIPVPKKYPKFGPRPVIPSTPDHLAAPANWDFTGMNPTSSTLYLWSNIGLKANKVILYENYSSFFRVVRIAAYMFRTLRAPYNNPTHKWLKPEETHRALVRLILIEQLDAFEPDIKHAIQHKKWPKDSKLISLAPIIGPRGELRVGGRLKLLNCGRHKLVDLPNLKHVQIIVPRCHMAVLLIRDIHTFLGHSQGRDRLITELRQVCWIQSLRPMVEKLLALCVTCQKMRREAWQPIMGPLPPGAVPMGRLLPFRNISADFAGPFIVVIGKQRHERFVLLYICQQTKCVHAEVTESLELQHVKNAFTRVFSRKGVPETMRTDNGPSLVAFRNKLWSDTRHAELYERLKEVDWEKLREFGGKAGIKDWEFSPPLAPNFNGLAEAAVRIWKKAMQTQFRKQTLRLDEFLTATALAEDIINGRPLDYTEGKLYTPNHLTLRGPPQEALPIIDPDHIRTIGMRHQLIEDVAQNIWIDFTQGWLYQAQRLPKWQEYRKNLEPGTLVVLFTEDKLKSTRNQWDVGRIVSVKLGADGQARRAVVAVQRPQNKEDQFDLVTHDRAINKLVPIDLIAEQVQRILPVDITNYPKPDPEVEAGSQTPDDAIQPQDELNHLQTVILGEEQALDSIRARQALQSARIRDPSTPKLTAHEAYDLDKASRTEIADQTAKLAHARNAWKLARSRTRQAWELTRDCDKVGVNKPSISDDGVKDGVVNAEVVAKEAIQPREDPNKSMTSTRVSSSPKHGE